MMLLQLLTFITATGGLCLFDRISKIYALVHYLEKPYMINKYVCLITEFNSGSSWGIISGNSFVQQLFLMIAPLILLGIIGIYYARNNPIASSLIIAGGLSNLYDRIVYKGVIDFILLKTGNASFPIFNLADFYISLGILLLFYRFFYHEQ